MNRTDGGGAVAAGLASGFRDDLERRSSLLGSGGRAGFGCLGFAAWPRNWGLRGGSLGASGSSGRGEDPEGERKLFPSLFDNCIGRKRDVGGGVLAGLCCLGWFGASWIGLGDGVRRDY